jgi:hypothetical protein
MSDGTLRRLARLERRQRRAGEGHEQSDRVEKTLVSHAEYNAALRPLMVECRLPVWPASADGDEWMESRGLSSVVVAVRLTRWLDEHPGIDGKDIPRAEIRAAVLVKPQTNDEWVQSFIAINGGVS